jgi:hypothetical protein
MNTNKNKIDKVNKPLLLEFVLVALISAALTLLGVYCCVLPKYYGFDPTGLGAQFGLAQSDVPANQTRQIVTNNHTNTLKKAYSGPSATQINQDMLPEQKNDAFSLNIAAKQTLEFKLDMMRDYELDYYWQSGEEPLEFELRGLKPTPMTKELKVFGKVKGNQGKGFFIAPFNGEIIFYWQNKTNQPTTIRLITKGYYTLPKTQTGQLPMSAKPDSAQ